MGKQLEAYSSDGLTMPLEKVIKHGHEIIQSDLNDVYVSSEALDISMRTNGSELVFTKYDVNCGIRIEGNGSKFDLKPWKGEQNRYSKNKSLVTNHKLPSKIRDLIDEL